MALSTQFAHWWHRPAGMRQVLFTSMPLVISTLSLTLMHFIDRVFLMWYSPDAVAASLPAGILAFTVVCFPLGVATYTNTFVSQYHGARRYDRIGVAVWQGIWIGVFILPLVLATNLLAPQFFHSSLVSHEPAIAALEIDYFRVLNYGGGAIVIAAALSAFFTGRGSMRTVMVVDILASGLNIVLDYAWIFGNCGFPRWGIIGAGCATVAAVWFKALLYLALLLRPRYRHAFQTIAGCRFDRRLLGRLLWFGSPSGMQFLLEVGGFGLFVLLVGQLGAAPLTATNLAFNVNSLAFMPILGVGLATSTLVGQRVGENRPDLAARATWSAITLTCCYMMVISAVYLLAPDLLLMPYRAEADPAEFARIRDMTVVLLRFVASYCLFDAMNIIFSSAIKGAGDTRFVMITSLVLSAVLVGFTWAGIHFWGFGLYGCWTVATSWVVLLGVVYWLRFLQGKWRKMRVIEVHPTLSEAASTNLVAEQASPHCPEPGE